MGLDISEWGKIMDPNTPKERFMGSLERDYHELRKANEKLLGRIAELEKENEELKATKE